MVNEKEQTLVPVGFACQPNEPTDQEICDMIDTVISQVLGPEGLAAIIKPGNKVAIKVNIVNAPAGARGEKGRGVITDPRIVRYVAEKVREIIGFAEPADLKVIDATHYLDSNPSLKSAPTSFYWARLERNGNNAVDQNDICYDGNGDGVLDGTSQAKLINADSFDSSHRQAFQVKPPTSSSEITVGMPKLICPRQEGDNSDDYCDVLIGLPVFKSHGLVGITGALKLHYGFRHFNGMLGDSGRWGHDGLVIDATGFHNKQNLLNYLCAQQLVRKYDLVIMDCLTGNRQGPLNPYGQISTNFYLDEPVDYILTNAILASCDPVAIDTVETVLGGYDPESIALLQTAHQNGLGTNQPDWIDLIGFNNFSEHRKHLYNMYSRDKYPFQDGWGEARVRENYVSSFSIRLIGPELVEEGIYTLEYIVGSLYKPQLKPVRIELYINHQRVAFLNHDLLEPGAELEHGKFKVDLTKLGFAKDSYLSWFVALWDESFNCIPSDEIIARC